MAMQILIVDDEADVELIFRQKFRRRIRKGELEFFFAEDGAAALQVLRQQPEIALVFTDLNMPMMGGLALLRELRALERRELVALVVSAYGDMDNIRAAMNQGAFDFLTKPIDLDDLELVLEKSMQEVENRRKGIETEEKLSESEAQRKESDYLRKLQKEFFDNITHEIRTPLTLLLGPLEQVAGLAESEAARRLLLQAQRNGQLLLDLVNQLLDFARVDARAMRLYPQPIDLRDTAEQLAEAFRPFAAEKQIDLRLDLPPQLPGIFADPKLSSRIFLNLLSNALKFTPEGGRVVLSLSAKGNGVLLQVQDSGPGISAEDRERIFERFFQAKESAAYQGTGIGLALTRAIAELHGGHVGIDSEAGQGACFSVFWPPSPPPQHVAEDAAPRAEASVENEAAADEEAPLLLLAEDNAEMRAYVQGILAQEFRVLAVENGRLALEAAEELLPDLLVSDVMMPEMDGYQLCAQLKSQKTTSHIPIVLLTAKASPGQRIEGIEAGADAYLPKPFQAAELLATLRNILAQRALMRERHREEFLLRPQQSKELSMDEQFLAKVRDLIEAHIDDDQFGVEAMADDLAMSRRNLTRKLKALTGSAPAQLIRSFRLEKAIEMLRQQSAPIREVAMRTGFGSSSYFTNCFKQHYGKSPREYMEGLQA